MKQKLIRIGMILLMLICCTGLLLLGFWVGNSVGYFKGQLQAQVKIYENTKKRHSLHEELKQEYKNAQIRLGLDKRIIGSQRLHDTLSLILEPDTVKITLR